jgi:hypothetical protein
MTARLAARGWSTALAVGAVGVAIDEEDASTLTEGMEIRPRITASPRGVPRPAARAPARPGATVLKLERGRL